MADWNEFLEDFLKDIHFEVNPCFVILIQVWLKFMILGWANSQLVCCSVLGQYWDAYTCPFPMESCWHFTGICYIGDHCKNNRSRIRCQGVWIQQQDFHSCKIWQHSILLCMLFNYIIHFIDRGALGYSTCVGWDVLGTNWGICICSSQSCFECSFSWGTHFIFIRSFEIILAYA